MQAKTGQTKARQGYLPRSSNYVTFRYAGKVGHSSERAYEYNIKYRQFSGWEGTAISSSLDKEVYFLV